MEDIKDSDFIISCQHISKKNHSLKWICCIKKWHKKLAFNKLSLQPAMLHTLCFCQRQWRNLFCAVIGDTSGKSHGACTASIHSLQTQMWWQAPCIWQRPMSSGYWMNGPQYYTEWVHSHMEAALLFKSNGRSHSMCTSPLRHGEQWDACTRPLPAHCRAGPLRPLGCLIKSETITFTRLSSREACMHACMQKKKKKVNFTNHPLPHTLKYKHIAK